MGLNLTTNYQAQNPYDPSVLSTAIGNGAQVYGQQQSLANALAQQAAGRGPNPAAIQTNNAIQQNTNSANALAQSQRGINPGLAARDAGMAAANASQVAAGQGAVTSAQQQIAAQQAQAGVMQNMAGNQLSQENMYGQQTLGDAGINAGIAEQNTKNNAGIVGGIISGASGVLGSMLGNGGMLGKAAKAAHGALVPGKDSVPGDSSKNDTKPYMLSPGEIVIPRSHASDPEKAKSFVSALLAHKAGKPNPKDKVPVKLAHGGAVVQQKKGFAAVIAAQHDLHTRMKALEGKRAN